MYQQDVSWAGFEWINANDSYRGIFSFVRKSKDGKNNLLFVVNFTPMEYKDYKVGVCDKKKHKLVLDSEDPKYGSGRATSILGETYVPCQSECDGRQYSISYPLAPYGVAVFVY